MRLRVVLACLLVPALAGAQDSRADAALLPGERAAVVTAIPGVVAADAKWELIWADFETADGIVGTPDGGVLFAQEQTDTIRKLDAKGKEYVFVKDSFGAGAVSIDAQGRLFAAQRACTDTARPFAASCPELPAISMVFPQRRTLANSFKDGRPLGRVNDVMADGKGGAYFTAGGAYHVNADGVVTVVEDQNLRSNGIMLSPDGKTLYVTNQKVVIAFDVKPMARRRIAATSVRSMATMAGTAWRWIRPARLYVTGNLGVHVLSPEGKHLGMIPTPRRPITLAFSGPDKKTLYVPQMGAIGPDGKAWTTPEGVRNTAMTIYKISMLAEGFKGRPK